MSLTFSNSSTKLPCVNILWTGGFDSSYRMVQLSQHEVNVQPYYLTDNRRSEQNELKAIAAITEDIEKRPDTKCKILPLIKFKVSDIEPDKAITEAYERLLATISIGPQYDWLARYAKSVQGLELCLEKSKISKAYNCIMQNGDIKKISNGNIAYAIIDEKESSPDLVKVFGGFHFPLPLFEKTKIEILEEYKILGFGETINKTWFCHRPINNEPCGWCNPCKSVIEEGLPFRIPPKGLKRYKIEKKFERFKWYKSIKDNWLRIIGS